MRREYNEKDRLRIIERYISNNEGPRSVNRIILIFKNNPFCFAL